MEFFATCPGGFEDLLADELNELGCDRVRKLTGQVSFEGEIEAAYKVCLWSRLASRVILVLDRFKADTVDEFYSHVVSLSWEEHIGRGKTMAIDANGMNDQFRNTQFLAMRTKDAISDHLRSAVGWRADVERTHPDVRIVVRLNQNRVTLGIDLTGDPLFKRGWEMSRNRVKVVPLRADYAAALLVSAGWKEVATKPHPTAVIPFAGAGTLACEAVSIARNCAPGLLRSYWGFTGWLGHDADAWNKLVAEAQAVKENYASDPCHLICSDMRPSADIYTKQSLGAAGLSCDYTFTLDLAAKDTKRALRHAKNAVVVCDLSWLFDDDYARHAKALATMAQVRTELAEGTHIAAISPGDTLDSAIGLDAYKIQRIFTGNSKSSLRSYEIEGTFSPAVAVVKDQVKIPVLVENSQQFASRLTKVHKQRKKWAVKELVSCYRIYDQDLPDYAVAIDLYQDETQTKRWLVISEYAAPKEIDADLAQKRLLDVLSIAPVVCDVRPEYVFLRVRKRDKGGSQYAFDKPAKDTRGLKPGELPPGAHLVEENGLLFEVSFTGKLDTGLFLDHRDTRNMLREMAKDTKGSKRFLNLFAYTGSATCYAADGGCIHTTTVDLSSTYLAWAKRNMMRNGFEGCEHEFIQADVLRWVSEQRHTKNRWDLIFVDPPTFSNSSSMSAKSFDVQRDHAEMLIDISRLLTRNGIAVFSCNLRSFKPDYELLAKAGVELTDITADTIPEDFKRNPKIHHCYLLKRVAVPGLPPREEVQSAEEDKRRSSESDRGRKEKREFARSNSDDKRHENRRPSDGQRMRHKRSNGRRDQRSGSQSKPRRSARPDRKTPNYNDPYNLQKRTKSFRNF